MNPNGVLKQPVLMRGFGLPLEAPPKRTVERVYRTHSSRCSIQDSGSERALAGSILGRTLEFGMTVSARVMLGPLTPFSGRPVVGLAPYRDQVRSLMSSSYLDV